MCKEVPDPTQKFALHRIEVATSRHALQRALPIIVLCAVLLSIMTRLSPALAADPVGLWDQRFPEQLGLVVTNPGSSSLPAGYTISFELNHAALVTGGRSLANGADVRIAYWNGLNWTEIDRAADLSTGWNSPTTRIWFKTQAELPAGGGDTGYYLCYGYLAASLPGYEPHPVIVERKPLRDKLLASVNAVLTANHAYFSDGTDYWRAAPGYVYSFAADTWYAFTGYPDHFTPQQIKNFFTKIIAARDSNGDFPIALYEDGSPYVYYSAWDLKHRHVTGDGVFFTPMMEKLYYDKSGDITAFQDTHTYLRTALSHIPRDPVTKLVTVDPDDEWVPWGFQDAVRKTGNELMGSLLYYKASLDMAALYAAAGNAESAGFFTNEANDIRANISLLWDDTSGMFFGASGAQGHQIDIGGSAFAVYLGITTPEQNSAISSYLATHYETLTSHGFIRQSPEDWAYSYYINDPPIPGCFGSGEYDNGRWSVANEWVATALYITRPDKAAQYIRDFANGPDPTLECQVIAPGTYNGFTSNLESPMGAWKFYNDNPQLFADDSSTTTVTTADYGGVFAFWDDFAQEKGWTSRTGIWNLQDGVLEGIGNQNSPDTKRNYAIGMDDNLLVQADFRIVSYEYGDYSTAGICLNSLDLGNAYSRGFCSAFRATETDYAQILDEEIVWGARQLFPWTTAHWYRTKIARSGATIFSKIWPVTESEPTSWQQSYTFENNLAFSEVGLLTSHAQVQFDNLLIREFRVTEPFVGVAPDPPDTVIVAAPPNHSSLATALFQFSSSSPDAVFECSLDSAAFSVCTSPISYADLDEGEHAFRVRAATSIGMQDATPAVHSWRVDHTHPDTYFTSHPPVTTLDRHAEFTFAATETQVSYQCRLDNSAFIPCSSGYRIENVGIGPHTFSVQAVDAALNGDPFPAEFTWLVSAPSTCRALLDNACHDSLTSSYLAIAEGMQGTILVRNINLNEQFTADRDLTVTIQGGYMADYTLREEGSVVRSLVISRGVVIVDQLTIM
jgi:hypothetical protein